MAALTREDGARGQKKGRRGCEHYDRGCLLKVTTSLGLFLFELPLGRAGGEVGRAVRFGLKFEAKLLGYLFHLEPGSYCRERFWQGVHRTYLSSWFVLWKHNPCLGRAWACTSATLSMGLLVFCCWK